MNDTLSMCDKNSSLDDPRLKYKIDVKIPIGQGSFSTVYHAIDKLGSEYAIKCIPLSKLEKNNLDKFLLELEISMKMTHPNIVRSKEVFKTSNNWYIVTEYCNGGTLFNVIKNLNHNYAERELLCKRYLTQLKNSLKYLHKNNIIHRDLKPNNILITGQYPNDVLKLADFGFSRYFNSEKTNTFQENRELLMTSFCGTPLYMAPELLTNKRYNTKSDLWSFGVIMYEMLYGVNPYNYPKNLSNLVELIKTQEIEFPNTYSKSCLDLVKKLLQTDPAKRIEWDDFFKYSWFDKTIPSGFSKESLRGSIENLQTLNDDQLFPMEGIEVSSPKSVYPESPKSDHKRTHIEFNSQYLLTIVNEPEEDGFDIINTNELSPCDYNSYKEEEKYGILRILSNSIRTGIEYFLPSSK